MTHLTLSNAAITLLGMPDIPPHLYGLSPVKRQGTGWLFQVREPWRLEVVRETIQRMPATIRNRQVRRCVLRRLDGIRETQ